MSPETKTTKVAYNYIDDLLANMRAALGSLAKNTLAGEAKKAYDDLETRYRVLAQKRYAPYAESSLLANEANAALSRALKAIREVPPQTDASRMSGFHYWENKSGPQAISKIPGDASNPGWVVLPDLKFLGAGGNQPSAAANAIKGEMGDSLQLVTKGKDPRWPDFDTRVRATVEAWNQFLSLAPRVFDNWENFPSAKKLGLKSEKDYNPEYASPEKAPSAYPLGVQVLNHEGKQDWWDVGNKKNEKAYRPGIRLQFNKEDHNFYPVSVLATRELEMPGTKTDPLNQTIDLYDIDPKKLLALSLSLKNKFGYSVGELNMAITTVTGQAIGAVQDRVSQKVKSAPLSEKVVRARLASNMIPSGIERKNFDAEIEKLYPGAFNPKFVKDRQKELQKDGMYFILNRQACSLADEPGSGKTAQSVVGTDFATKLQDREAAAAAQAAGQPPPPQKKILVFTPLALLNEHWRPGRNPNDGSVTPSKPAMFCGHGEDSITHIRNLADFDKMGPQTRWVVIPYTTMSSADDNMLIAQRIAEESSRGTFGAVILDEIQTIKNLDKPQGEALRIAISAGGIKHRVGLSGTPADNDPSDLYKQLRVIRHPLLYDTAGVVQQTEKGFTKQFLGGAAYENEKDDIYTRMMSVFEWARHVNKRLLVDMFATTFLRRTKDDMRDDLPTKDRSHPKVIDGQAEHWDQRLEALRSSPNPHIAKNPWQALEEEMAFAKVPYTVQSIKTALQRPDAKVFVVTKYPDIAAQISNAINQELGQDGSAAFISGKVKTKSPLRQTIPDTFKQPGGTMPGKAVPLRCVIYTMEIGAVGLNFGMATKFIANDIDWNPSMNIQAEDRIHRIDTKHPAGTALSMEYVYFAGTYDEEMFHRVRGKEALNLEINEALKQSQKHSGDPAAVDRIANRFIVSLCKSLVYELHLSPQDKDFAAQKLRELENFLNGGGGGQVQQSPQSPAGQIGAPSPEPMALSASSGAWYKRFKMATRRFRHLW